MFKEVAKKQLQIACHPKCIYVQFKVNYESK
jgi:hypothetical protein